MNYMMIVGAIFGLTGVAFGAFGAHSLKALIAPEMLEVWKTAVSYQMYHTSVLFVLGWIMGSGGSRLLNWSGASMVAGVLLFSGSLYILVLMDMPHLGMITPVGGSLLLLGWLLLLMDVVRRNAK